MPTPSAKTYSPGRTIGRVDMVDTKDRGFVFLRDASNEEHFAHKTAFEPEVLFGQVEVGTIVSFKVTQTTKGQRAYDIRRPEPEEHAAVDTFEDALAAAKAGQINDAAIAELGRRGGGNGAK